MLTNEVVHTINNQLAIVMSKADLLAGRIQDQGVKRNCEEIQIAVRKINMLLDNLVTGSRVEAATDASRRTCSRVFIAVSDH
jgi:two-component sensor histidine kinase